MARSSVRDQVLSHLETLGVVLKARLPEISERIVRPPREVAVRVIELYALIATSMPDVPAGEVRDWLKEVGLWKGICAWEKGLLRRAPRRLSEKERKNISWLRESMYTLCWSLSQVDKLPPPYHESNSDDLLPFVPPQVSVQTFLDSAKYRPSADIYFAIDLHYCIHSAIRAGDAVEMDESVVRERRQALEWLISQEPWWEVTLDT